MSKALAHSPVNAAVSAAGASPVSRRRLFAGAGTAGALAAAASLLPAQPEAVADAALAPKAKPESGGGYQLTDHVKQYYQTAKV